jgi:hypothetical protein
LEGDHERLRSAHDELGGTASYDDLRVHNRRDRQLEPVRVTQPEDSLAPPEIPWLVIESGAPALDALCEIIDALFRDDLDREAGTLCSVQPYAPSS